MYIFTQNFYIPYWILTSRQIQLRLIYYLRKLQKDDLLIAKEGLKILSDKELYEACIKRAIFSVEQNNLELQEKLSQWIILSQSEIIRENSKQLHLKLFASALLLPSV